MHTDDQPTAQNPLPPTASRWEWFKQKMQTRHARRWLALYAFFESVILPVPTDIFLALMVFANKRSAIQLAVLTTAASIAGAVVLYFMTLFFDQFIFQSLVASFGFESDIQHAAQALQRVAFIAMFIAAFSPIPYTPAIIAAGLLGMNFFVFLFASILGRGLRYGLVSFAVYVFGASIVPNIQKTSIVITSVITAIVIVLWFVFQFFT